MWEEKRLHQAHPASVDLPKTWQLPGRAGGSSLGASQWGGRDPTATRHGTGPVDLRESTVVPRCVMVWADPGRHGHLPTPFHQGTRCCLATAGPWLPTSTELTGAAPLEWLLPHVLQAHWRGQPAAQPSMFHRLSTHHKEPLHPQAARAHAGTVSPIQQHPWLGSAQEGTIDAIPHRGCCCEKPLKIPT